MPIDACISDHSPNQLQDFVMSPAAKGYPDKWMTERIHLVFLRDILTGIEIDNLRSAICDNSQFACNHVAGQKLDASPNRGVRVMADKTNASKTFAWTAHASKASVTMESSAEPFPPGLTDCIGKIRAHIKTVCPGVDEADDGFATLAVVNRYDNVCNRISPHEDDQPWYADPCIFASITFYEKDLEHPDFGARFFVKHINGDNVRVHLPDASLLVMSAKITHEVRPPPKKLHPHYVTRYNATLRNLHKDPFLRYMGYANHFRYYGNPQRMVVPQGLVDNPDIVALAERFKSIHRHSVSNKMVIAIGESVSNRAKRKREYRDTLTEYYSSCEPQHKRLMKTTLSKSNVVLEAMQHVCTELHT